MSESRDNLPPQVAGSPRRRMLALALGAMVALAAVWLAGPHPPAWAPPCPLHALTGLHCPGCGSTRAVLALVHGEPLRAFQQNPLLVLSVPLLLGWGGLVGWRRLRHGPPVGLPRYTALVALVVFILYFILRNLPWWPCTLLAPHG